jgi:SHS2 domain-containing protein
MPDFEVIDHTADIGIIAYGKDKEEVFANSAYGMFSLIAELEGVADEACYNIEVGADDEESLLVTWLNELLYLFDVERVIFKRFEIVELGEYRLQANAYGEKFNPSRHSLKMQIKAATYYLLKLEKGNGFKAKIIFDV